LEEMAAAYKSPLSPLVPRPALILVGYIASGLYLLEHATWAHNTGQPDCVSDVEVFRRWTLEGGLVAAIEDVRRVKTASEERMNLSSMIVYAGPLKTRL